jgi:glycosyltransferase involved in cell wall biosynthesis
MPTRNEPFGLVFIEAFAYSLPVVSSQIGALPDVVEDGFSGYLVEPDDIQALSERLIALLGDPERAQVFGSRGRSRVENRYTWSNVARIMSEHIQRHVPGVRATR